MRTSLLCAILMSVCISTQSCNASYAKEEKGVKANAPEERLEISFKFQRGGIASSQYAIWIEDEAGRLVRTLYATSFTAKGGYEYRKEALPVWVGKAKPQAMSSIQVDAITGATPQNGLLTYQWDGTDHQGNHVPAGKYTFFVEGTLYWESRVIYSGELDWGGREQDSIPVKARYFHPSSNNQEMITGLKASHIKVSQ